MTRPLVLASVATAVLLAVAIVVRMNDAPYIAYAQFRYADAMEGLKAKAEKGDPFATLLVAKNYERGVDGTPDKAQASDWYVKAARRGEIRSVSRYLNLNVNPSKADQCEKARAVLESAGRTGDLGALTLLGRYYSSGFCIAADLAMAARYYMAAARIDGRFNDTVEMLAARIDPQTARDLHPLPEQFDTDAQSAALTQFLAALPFDTAAAIP